MRNAASVNNPTPAEGLVLLKGDPSRLRVTYRPRTRPSQHTAEV